MRTSLLLYYTILYYGAMSSGGQQKFIYAADKAVSENCLSFCHPARVLAIVRILLLYALMLYLQLHFL